jgi:DNA-binding PadR family transcriptional regulator
MEDHLKGLSTTSYAILGLLALRPFTTYELAQEMGRSIHYMWPRAESGLYEEPKNLVAHGLAKSTRDFVGRRRRTTYAITPKGRRALRSWLKEPGAGPSLEFEALLQVLYAEQGTKADLLATVAAIRQGADDSRATLAEMAHELARNAGPFPFPQRSHVNFLVLAFQTEQSAALRRWSTLARREINAWSEDMMPPPQRDYRRQIARLAADLEGR